MATHCLHKKYWLNSQQYWHRCWFDRLGGCPVGEAAFFGCISRLATFYARFYQQNQKKIPLFVLLLNENTYLRRPKLKRVSNAYNTTVSKKGP